MLRVLVDEISPRIEYAFEFIFGSRGVDYQLTTDSSSEFHFAYSKERNITVPHVEMAAFMTQTHLENIPLTVSEFEGMDCYAFDGVVDPVASIFYHLTRYEEYISETKDEYGRFPFLVSTAPENWVKMAMCDRWSAAILKHLGLEPTEVKEVNIVPSFDIDNTYAYKLKRGKRKLLSSFKDLLQFNFERIKERQRVLRGKMNDPYDTFSTIRAVQKRFPQTKVFWLIGKWGKKDRNISIKNKAHRQLIKSLCDEGVDIGLHPSFGSFLKKEVIASEKKELEEVCGKSISNSRQHFLRFQIPSTFADLHDIGFKNEYSMGYAERVGFRAGTARPHRWFDLSRNEVSGLIIHPFVYMDGTLREYMNLSIEESKTVIHELYDEVATYGGDFIFIWHNETIGNYGNWKGWKEVLDFTLNLGEKREENI